MPNFFETLRSAFDTLIDDEPKPPINIIEASNCWLYYGMISEAIRFEQVGINTTTDDELLGILVDAEKLCARQAEKLKKLMRDEGVTLPPVTEEKPNSDPLQVPPGVKLTDAELSGGLAVKMVAMTSQAALGAANSVRSDIGMLWVEFLNETLAYGMSLKTKMRKRGWAKIPPAFKPPGI